MLGKTMMIPRAIRRLVGGLLLSLLPLTGMAESLALPAPGSDLVGRIRHVKARQGDTLIDIAHRNSVGQDEIVMANPTESRYYWVPGEGTKVKIPDQFILPDAPRVGIVVNIPEMRLYYYPPGPNKEAPTEVFTYPISIGRMDWKSPMGVTKIVEKIKDPTWTPPESIKREHALDGEILPDVVPAGPDNPLGQFAMRLGVKGSYLIHGTGQNKADGIGMMVTHGCMRMYPEDVAQLFPKVSVGTQVNLVNQPVKLGWQGDTLYIEVSQPLDEDNLSYSQLANLASGLIQKKTAERPGIAINREALKQALEKPNGIPTPITGAFRPVTAQQATSPQAPTPDSPTPRPTLETPFPAGVAQPAPDAKPALAPVQPPRNPTQALTPTIPPRPAGSAMAGQPVRPVVPTASANPAPPVRKPLPAKPLDVPPGPPVTPSSSKPEQQLLPPIY
jgi:L,D-transpeptidase ErfK/SrfK